MTTFKLTPHESVTVRDHSLEALEVEGTWGPGGRPPPKHFHPNQAERFELLDGTLWARVDGQEHRLSPGNVLEVPRGEVHQMWNAAEVPARAVWRTAPAGRTYEWFAALDGLLRSDRVGRNGMPSPLAFGAYLTEYSDVIRLAGPQPLVGGALRLLGEIGRRRGYRPPSAGTG